MATVALRNLAPMPMQFGASGPGSQDNQRAQAGYSSLHKAAPHLPYAHLGHDTQEIVLAVESLYDDWMKPYGRILRKRLSERAEAAGRPEADLHTNQLRKACEACEWINCKEESGGDWVALLPADLRQPTFIDCYSPVDVYPVELWSALGAYFEQLGQLGREDMYLPGGRYACSKELARRSLPFLQRFRLGEVCHIVQLAISQKKMLGYLNGTVVPYSRSQSMVKENCAKRGVPNASRSTTKIATWDAVARCLQEILRTTPGNSIPLSNIKRLFRSRHQMELSETALGHAKLSELLQDERLRDICDVRLHGHGYVVFLPHKSDFLANQISIADNLPGHNYGASESSTAKAANRQRARDAGCESSNGDPAATNFAYAPVPMAVGPLPQGFTAAQLAALSSVVASPAASASTATRLDTASMRAAAMQHTPNKQQTSAVQQLQQAQLRQAQLLQHFQQAVDASLQLDPAFAPTMNANFVPSPPFAAPDLGDLSAGSTARPSEFGDVSVHNTFLHAKGPPLSPGPRARRRRSLSLPKNIGATNTVDGAYAGSSNEGCDNNEGELGTSSMLNISEMHGANKIVNKAAPPPQGANKIVNKEAILVPSRGSRGLAEGRIGKLKNSSLAQRREFAPTAVEVEESIARIRPAWQLGSGTTTASMGSNAVAAREQEDGGDEEFLGTIPNTPATVGDITSPHRRPFEQQFVFDSLADIELDATAQRLRGRTRFEHDLCGRRRAGSADGIVSCTPSPCRSPRRSHPPPPAGLPDFLLDSATQIRLSELV